MEYIISCILVVLLSSNIQASPIDTTFLRAMHHGVKVIKPPHKGRIKSDVTLANPNQIWVRPHLHPKSRDKDYHIVVTTSTKRVITSNDSWSEYVGKVKPEEFPLLLEVRYKDQQEEWIEFTAELLVPNYGYLIYILYDKEK